jgi:vancomycin permeability regulator SanA
MTKRPFILLAALIALLAVVLLLNRYTVDNKPLNNMQNNQQTSDNQTIMPQDNEPIKGDSVFPEPNQPPYYHVKIGDTIDLDSENYIKFLRVTGDSRCPSDLVCETSGLYVLTTLGLDFETASVFRP